MRKERGGLCGIIKHVDQSFFKWASRGIKKPDSKPNLVHGPTLTPPCVGFSNPLTLSFLGPSTFEVSENSSKASPSHLVISSAAEDESQVTHEPSAVLGQPVETPMVVICGISYGEPSPSHVFQLSVAKDACQVTHELSSQAVMMGRLVETSMEARRNISDGCSSDGLAMVLGTTSKVISLASIGLFLVGILWSLPKAGFMKFGVSDYSGEEVGSGNFVSIIQGKDWFISPIAALEINQPTLALIPLTIDCGLPGMCGLMWEEVIGSKLGLGERVFFRL